MGGGWGGGGGILLSMCHLSAGQENSASNVFIRGLSENCGLSPILSMLIVFYLYLYSQTIDEYIRWMHSGTAMKTGVIHGQTSINKTE